MKKKNSRKKEEDLDLQILPPEHRISPEELSKSLQTEIPSQRHLLVDVRSESEFHMCNIDGSTNYPIDKLTGNLFVGLLEEIRKSDGQVTFICRRGNDSQVIAQRILSALPSEQHDRVKDLVGGLHGWAKRVDNDFPVY